MAKTSAYGTEGARWTPSQEPRSQVTCGQLSQNIKAETISVTNSIEDFKTVHIKKREKEGEQKKDSGVNKGKEEGNKLPECQ